MEPVRGVKHSVPSLPAPREQDTANLEKEPGDYSRGFTSGVTHDLGVIISEAFGGARQCSGLGSKGLTSLGEIYTGMFLQGCEGERKPQAVLQSWQLILLC